MINFFLRFKTQNIDSKELKIEDIQQAGKVLFSLFTRYGDTIINLVIIEEFIKLYPEKKCLILCPRQMQPYVNELLPNIECFALNKRNLFDMFKINLKLKKWQPDIGFNPWSNGLDSCYFLTYCKKYFCYKDFNKPNVINHYQVVRKYLQIPEKGWRANDLIPKDTYQHVLICPQSTDKERSISINKINDLIKGLKKIHKNAQFKVASMDRINCMEKCENFIFTKSYKSSQQFIDLIKKSDLIISADTGPLHIALALNKDVMAYFYSTKPEMVINSDSVLKLVKV